MPRRQTQLGRRFEEQIAEATGGERVHRLSFHQSVHDVDHPLFIGEAKVRQSIAVIRWLEKAETYCHDDRPAVLFCRETGSTLDQAIVVMRLPTFLKLKEAI